MPVNNDPMISTPPTVQTTPTVTQPKEPGKISRIFGSLLGGGVNMVAPGLGGIIGGLINRGGGPNGTDMQAMLDKQAANSMLLLTTQMAVQDQSQNFTAATNLMKARHEGEMSAVHNFKS